MPDKNRCPWAKDELECAYHDYEWCRPEHDDRKLFELLILEGMQAGLSWNIILKKRENMRRAFDDFDPEVITGYDEQKKNKLLENPGIIRNRAKLDALVKNAAAFLRVKKEYGSFDAYIWSFIEGEPIQNSWTYPEDVPAKTGLSERISKELLRRGFKFVGPTICYSYMQAIGMVNDHLLSCDYYRGSKDP